MVHLGTSPISSSASLTGSGILGTVPLDGPIETMLGIVTAIQPLPEYQYFPTQLPIATYQSFSKTDTCAQHNIHLLRPDQAYIHVAVALCEGACRFSTIYYPQITVL